MSILSPLYHHVQLQKTMLADNQAKNPLHPNKSDDEYEELRRVYYPVKECI